MATSSVQLARIIDVLGKKYKFDMPDAMEYLAEQDLLPKKLIDDIHKSTTPWASKKAEELAKEHDIKPNGKGSGKDGKWTQADVKKAMESPKSTNLNVSPNALLLANKENISLVGIKGTGANGRVLLKDVQDILDKTKNAKKDEELMITPFALQYALENHISDDELSTITGTGVGGRIVKDDIIKHVSSDDEKPKPKSKSDGKKKAKPVESSEDEDDDDE
jgi:pyruvate/2-oxoglutarate dehydrogenase complex dihydrolipoamide acyltransferase (E2) component